MPVTAGCRTHEGGRAQGPPLHDGANTASSSIRFRPLHGEEDGVERGRAADEETVAAGAAEVHVGDGFGDEDFAGQGAVGFVAVDAVAGAGPDAAEFVAAEAVEEAGGA